MPELPDVELYLAALRPRILRHRIDAVRIASPFFVRTFEPPAEGLAGHEVVDLRRMGKRVVWALDGGLFAVFHLMIAGRFRWRARGAAIPGKVGLAAFDFPEGSLLVTEAGSKRQASLPLVRGTDALEALDPGGIELDALTARGFAERLRKENHTLKRALTDPRLFSGIGNAYSDEILHAAMLSPMKLTQSLTDAEAQALFAHATRVLRQWTSRLIAETGPAFPEKVTAFREGMAAHGRFGQPCPRCGTPIQRIVYARNEANYCPACQTGGRLLADRALSRLLRDDWPKTLEDLERLKSRS